MTALKIDVVVNKGRVIGVNQGLRGLAGQDTLESGINADRAEVAAAAALVSENNANASEIAAGNSVIASAVSEAQTNADVVSTAQDAINTAADRVQTGLDVIATASDVMTTGNNAAASAASASSAAASAITAENLVIQSLVWKGVWDASGGIYPSSPSNGHYWTINVGGTISGTPYVVGDEIGWDGINWVKVPIDSSVTSVQGRTGNVTIVKSDINLGNVDNTSDADKPISIAVAAALNDKLPASTELSDITTSSSGRIYLDVYSKAEVDAMIGAGGGSVEIGEVVLPSYKEDEGNGEVYLKLDGSYYFDVDYPDLAALVKEQTTTVGQSISPFGSGESTMYHSDGAKIVAVSTEPLSYGDVRRSTDYGVTWNSSGENIFTLAGVGGITHTIRHIMSDGDTTVMVYNVAATSDEYGCYYTTDNGTNWTKGNHFTVISSNSLMSASLAGTTVLLAFGASGLWVSTNTGGSFTQRNIDGHVAQDVDCYGAYALCGTDDNTDPIYKSSDSGLTWSKATTKPTSTAGGRYVSMGTLGNWAMVGGTGKLWWSTDYGVTWSTLNHHAIGNTSEGDICVDRGNNSLYVALITGAEKTIVTQRASVDATITQGNTTYPELKYNGTLDSELFQAYNSKLFGRAEINDSDFVTNNLGYGTFQLKELPVNTNGTTAVEASYATTHYKVRAK